MIDLLIKLLWSFFNLFLLYVTEKCFQCHTLESINNELHVHSCVHVVYFI